VAGIGAGGVGEHPFHLDGWLPTRDQHLAAGLKQCKKRPKKKRAKCEATVRKKYGSKARSGAGEKK
jgi:hypothetical protein